MLSIYLLLVYLISTASGIYLFDYQLDQSINNPLIIVGSFLGGFVVTFLAALLFLESTYLIFAKNKPDTNKIKHLIGKQIVSVPMHFFNVWTTVIGRENLPTDTKFLIYANHTSELDISILMCNLKKYPVAFLAKEAVGRYLSVGKWAKSIGCIMLNREDNRQGAQSVFKVAEKVQQGLTMVVFPEGSVKRELNTLLKFRSGAFKIALEAGVPIVPITLVKDKNYNTLWPLPRRFMMFIHEPIPFETIHTMKTRELSHTVRDIISNELEKYRFST